MSLNLYQRPTGDEAHLPLDLDSIARNYRRLSRSVGGWYSASFGLQNLPAHQLQSYFNTWIGYVVKESAFGMQAWEGIIYSMQLTLGSAVYEISLQPESWHNNVIAYYSDLAVEDTDQGNLSYTDEAGAETFTDAGQDFTAWQTATAGTDSVYRIQVANTNNTTSWGYLGAIVGITEIYVFTGPTRATAGWNGQDPTGLTPEHYEVITVANYGVRRDTGWSANANSVSEYGEMEYLITLSGSQPTPATALRDSHLTEFAWPRARFVGVADEPDSLAVTCAGFWSTLFWRYWEHSRTAAASTLVGDLADDGEFTSAGRIETNALVTTADGFPMPQRIADILEWLTDKGDSSGNIWKCGVYDNRKLVYEQAPTTVDYIWRDGRLLNKAGQAVVPQLLKPGFYVRTESALGAVQPPGTSGIWDDPQVAYVDEVEWSRDDGSLTLSLRNAGPSLIMRRQILAGIG